METESDLFMEPPNYYIYDHIFGLDFHPKQNILGISTITGNVELFSKKCQIFVGFQRKNSFEKYLEEFLSKFTI